MTPWRSANARALRGLQTRTSENGPDQTQRFQVAVGLHTGPQNREHRGVRAGEVLGGNGRCGRGPHFGDQPPVHHRERLSGFGAEQHDHRMVGVHALIVGVERHQFGAECAGVGRHDREEAPVGGDRQHRAHRLHDASRRQVGERPCDGGNEVLVV